MIKIIDVCKPTDLIYIAIDGVCPRGKIEQQKYRRFRSAGEKKIWDTNAISPGTKFMNDLNIFLMEYPVKRKRRNILNKITIEVDIKLIKINVSRLIVPKNTIISNTTPIFNSF